MASNEIVDRVEIQDESISLVARALFAVPCSLPTWKETKIGFQSSI